MCQQRLAGRDVLVADRLVLLVADQRVAADRDHRTLGAHASTSMRMIVGAPLTARIGESTEETGSPPAVDLLHNADRGAPPFPGRRGRAGRRLPAVRLRARTASRPRRLRAQRRRRASSSRPKGRRRRSTRSPPRCSAEAPPLARVDAVAAEPLAAGRRTGVHDRGEHAAGRTRADPARHRDVRRLPARALRSGRPPLPLPVHQLHAVRAALHDRALGSLRPAEHDDGRLPALRRLPPRVRGPGRPALPRRAGLLPRLRTAAVAAARARRSTLLRGGAIVAVKGLGG